MKLASPKGADYGYAMFINIHTQLPLFIAGNDAFLDFEFKVLIDESIEWRAFKNNHFIGTQLFILQMSHFQNWYTT